MLEIAALTYGVLTSFVLSSTERSRRNARSTAPVVQLAGWALMAFSGTGGAMLFGYAALRTVA